MSSSEPIPTRIVSRRQIAQSTHELKLELARPLVFQPGQYIDLTLPQLPVEPPYRVREFSLVSDPHDELLTIALRASGTAYKQALLDPGYTGPIITRGPIGIFILPEQPAGPLIFIAGGIGITPFLSILKHAQNQRPSLPITLLRVESSPERTAYRSELQDLAAKLPALRIMEHFGRLPDARALAALLPPLTPTTEVYIAGPLGMTSHTRSLVRELGVLPLGIHLEEFSGYSNYYEPV